eukprot:357796-Chlamydomonas_euryale.AAC.3
MARGAPDCSCPALPTGGSGKEMSCAHVRAPAAATVAAIVGHTELSGLGMGQGAGAGSAFRVGRVVYAHGSRSAWK